MDRERARKILHDLRAEVARMEVGESERPLDHPRVSALLDELEEAVTREDQERALRVLGVLIKVVSVVSPWLYALLDNSNE